MVARLENEFREFVVGFADPLTRLAFLLTAGADGDPAVRSADALARVRRQWRDAESTGAPESIAVEALLSALPHRRPVQGHPGAEGADDSDYVLATTGAGGADAVNHDAFRRPVSAAEPVSGGPPDSVGDVVHDADAAIDIEVLHDTVWKAWQRLSPRQRVPLVFVDPSVASRRLAGLGVPESFGSPRRQNQIAAAALAQLRTTLAADPTIGKTVGNLREWQFFGLLADTLREYGSSASRVVDPYPIVVRRAQRLGRRAAVAVAAVLVVLGAGFVVAVLASQPTKASSAVAPATASRSSSPTVAAAGASPSATSTVAAQGTVAPAAARPTGPVLVVPWLPRGTAAHDDVLLAHLTSYFTTVHKDATGQTQVLLATDTPTLRLAYVTANSPNGVIQAWFYGPVGSDNLIEGASSYGGSLLPDSVLADGLIDSTGHERFVVIAPPATTGMQIADFDFNDRNIDPGFAPLPYQNGIAVKDMAAGSSAASFVVDVTVGAATFTMKDAPDIQLRPQFTGSVTSDGPPSSPLPTPALERGHPDATLLADALRDAGAWEGSNPIVAARPVVLWAGADDAGTKVVVLRVNTLAYDVMVVESSGTAPADHAEYLVDPAAPDAPVAFAYRAVDGTRIGVIASAGAAMVVRRDNGAESGPFPFDSTGFVSFLIPNPPPDPNSEGSGALGVVAQLQLLDTAGRPLAGLSVPPALGG